jgi:hypothetical protein
MERVWRVKVILLVTSVCKNCYECVWWTQHGGSSDERKICWRFILTMLDPVTECHVIVSWVLRSEEIPASIFRVIWSGLGRWWSNLDEEARAYVGMLLGMWPVRTIDRDEATEHVSLVFQSLHIRVSEPYCQLEERQDISPKRRNVLYTV